MPGPHLPPPSRPLGDLTRGTTHPNRLRRIDRWLVATQLARLRRADAPVVVDLGYGRDPVTTIELASRLTRQVPAVRVVGVEIDRERVAAAQRFAGPGLRFACGGFNLPLTPDERPATVVRAMNVLRQYGEADAAQAWEVLQGQLGEDGLLVEGTCDELGRRAGWVSIDAKGPRTLTFAARVADLPRPSALAERLPKALIHHNVAGERVHDFFTAWDATWRTAAGAVTPRERWVAAAAGLAEQGWRIGRNPARWREGELTIAWTAVAPRTGG
ncbi:MAG TPA: class I SAM-dependent methyltransferase [Mycobacteriales bacterium]|nr:class I SAM-dependent methyltransferase [Mycobacteriales bacterium]